MTKSRTTEREYHWDSIRALLMLLGIPYHVAMAYRANDVWILESGQGAPIFNLIAQAIHVFRMPAFFIIAGYFAALLLARRSPGEWFKGRLLRLGVPFFAALLTFNPLLNIICELSHLALPQALASWEHNSLTSGGYWVRHLWFIIVLLYFCGAAAMLCRWLPQLRQIRLGYRIDDWISRHVFGAVLATALVLALWEAVAIELFYMAGLATNLIQQILRVDQVIEFAPYFLIGCVIARASATKAALHRFSPAIALFAIVALLVDLLYRDMLWAPFGRFLDTLAAVALTQLLLAGFKRFADRPHPAVQEVVKASFVIYLVHLPIVAGLVVLAEPIALPLSLKASLIMLLTFALSHGAWRTVLRFPTLRFLFDGVRPPASAAPLPPLATRDLGRQSL